MQVSSFHFVALKKKEQPMLMTPLFGGVLNFVSMPFCLIPEVGCGQSPQSLINTGNSDNILCWKQKEGGFTKTQN